MTDLETMDVQRSLGRLEGKIDLILSNVQAHLLEDTARFDKIHVRQDRVEKKIWMFSGIISVIGTALTILATHAVSVFKFIQ